MHRTIVDLFLDSDAYRQKLTETAELFSTANEAFDLLLKDEFFQHDLRRLGNELLWEALDCQQAIESATTPVRAARAVVRFNALLVEAAGRTVAAPIHAAAGTKTKPYSKLSNDDATELIRLVSANAKHPNLVAGLDPHLRNAQSHAGITYEDERLTTRLRSESREYQYDEIVSATFEGLESLLAVHLCLQQHLAHHLDDADHAATFRSLGLESQDVVDLFLPSFSASVVQTELRDGVLVLTCDTDSPTGVTVALVGILRPLNDPDIHLVELRQPNGEVWMAPASAFQSYDSGYTGPFADEVAALALQREWVNADGVRRLGDRFVRRWVALRASAALSGSLRDALALLRQLRLVADHVGDPECAGTLSALTTLVRVQHLGMSPSTAETQVLETIQEWLDDSSEPELL